MNRAASPTSPTDQVQDDHQQIKYLHKAQIKTEQETVSKGLRTLVGLNYRIHKERGSSIDIDGVTIDARYLDHFANQLQKDTKKIARFASAKMRSARSGSKGRNDTLYFINDDLVRFYKKANFGLRNPEDHVDASLKGKEAIDAYFKVQKKALKEKRYGEFLNQNLADLAEKHIISRGLLITAFFHYLDVNDLKGEKGYWVPDALIRELLDRPINQTMNGKDYFIDENMRDSLSDAEVGKMDLVNQGYDKGLTIRQIVHSTRTKKDGTPTGPMFIKREDGTYAYTSIVVMRMMNCFTISRKAEGLNLSTLEDQNLIQRARDVYSEFSHAREWWNSHREKKGNKTSK